MAPPFWSSWPQRKINEIAGTYVISYTLFVRSMIWVISMHYKYRLFAERSNPCCNLTSCGSNMLYKNVRKNMYLTLCFFSIFYFYLITTCTCSCKFPTADIFIWDSANWPWAKTYILHFNINLWWNCIWHIYIVQQKDTCFQTNSVMSDINNW